MGKCTSRHLFSYGGLSQLDIKDLMGLATDGAAVVFGTREGLASKLKRENPCMININCVCHKLALACTDYNEYIKYIKDVSEVLRQTWKHFENFPKRMALLMKVRTNLKQVTVSFTKGKRVLARKLKKACKQDGWTPWKYVFLGRDTVFCWSAVHINKTTKFLQLLLVFFPSLNDGEKCTKL